MRAIAPLLAAVLLAGCATVGTRTPGDPYERLNRTIWGFNQGVDKVALKPASSVYRAVTPKPVRRGVSNIFSNLSEPYSAINALLQANPKRMFNSLGRFLVNTTIGIGGLTDRATRMGMKQTPEDFGQTLAVWGVKSSAYLVLPILGPSTVRDGIGSLASQLLDPYRVCLERCAFIPDGAGWGISAVEILSARSALTDAGADDFLKTSADPYATARSAFFQRRAAAIANQDDGPDTQAQEDAAMNAALQEIDDQAKVPDAAPASPEPAPESSAPSEAPPSHEQAVEPPAQPTP